MSGFYDFLNNKILIIALAFSISVSVSTEDL